jgi:hypothetical protein
VVVVVGTVALVDEVEFPPSLCDVLLGPSDVVDPEDFAAAPHAAKRHARTKTIGTNFALPELCVLRSGDSAGLLFIAAV